MTDEDVMREVFRRAYRLAHVEVEKITGSSLSRTERNGIAGLMADFVMGYEDFRRPRNDGNTWGEMFKVYLRQEHSRKSDEERLN